MDGFFVLFRPFLFSVPPLSAECRHRDIDAAVEAAGKLLSDS
jgi:hypothetical protein